ncbi:MAG: hypothetical protein ACE5FV_13760 [Woeseia sp.]
MRKFLNFAPLIAGLFFLYQAPPAYALSINKSVKIDAGSQADGASTVNGSISVGTGATVTGSLETVNGTIRIDDNAVVRDAETVNGGVKVGSGVKAEDIGSVNGAIRIGENATIDGEVSVVNGKIDVASGTRIGEDVSNVNGEIEISGAEIGGDLTTVNGDVTLEDEAVLRGNLTIEKPGGWSWKKSRKPKIIIGPGSRIDGRIIAEREVALFISDTAEVGGVSGEMSMEQAVRFSGKRP